MSVTTLNGATHPTGPAPGQGGVRAYDEADAAGTLLDRVRQRLVSVWQADEVREARHDLREADGAYDTFHQSMNLVGAILTVVIAGATAYAGINVMSSIGSTMALTQNDTFYNSSRALQDGINSFFTNLPTVFVVIALVLIIGYLTLLR